MKKQSKKTNDTNKRVTKDIIIDYIPYVIIIIVVMIIRTYIVTPIIVEGSSMVPTLNDGQTLILNKIGYNVKGLKRFDIVVVKVENSRVIKRVIGLPKESILYENGNLYINSRKVDENYSQGLTDNFSDVKLGSNEYFVMGDNRATSMDSRAFGPVNESQIIGKTNIIIFPFNKIGLVK